MPDPSPHSVEAEARLLTRNEALAAVCALSEAMHAALDGIRSQKQIAKAKRAVVDLLTYIAKAPEP